MKHGNTHNGDDCKVFQLQYNETISDYFLEYFKPKLSNFFFHNHVAWFQEEQYKTYLQKFLETLIMFVMDFVENYTFQEYKEVQEMHWHSFVLTILVHIYYMWNMTYIANTNCGENKPLIEYHYFISNDVEHDTLCMQHCFGQH